MLSVCVCVCALRESEDTVLGGHVVLMLQDGAGVQTKRGAEENGGAFAQSLSVSGWDGWSPTRCVTTEMPLSLSLSPLILFSSFTSWSVCPPGIGPGQLWQRRSKKHYIRYQHETFSECVNNILRSE